MDQITGKWLVTEVFVSEVPDSPLLLVRVEFTAPQALVGHLVHLDVVLPVHLDVFLLVHLDEERINALPLCPIVVPKLGRCPAHQRIGFVATNLGFQRVGLD